jgi:hypothetical protein
LSAASWNLHTIIKHLQLQEAFNVVVTKSLKKSKDAITLLKEDGIESKADIVNEFKRFIN